MSLSDCQSCGGTIALGPRASNVCNKCGNGLWAPAEAHLTSMAALLAERDRLAAQVETLKADYCDQTSRLAALHQTQTDDRQSFDDQARAWLLGADRARADYDELAAVLRGLVNSPTVSNDMWDRARTALPPANGAKP